jgi:hypothetical protein
MDVTNEIQKNHLIYGASDYTASSRHASGRSLNYADGPSISRPAKQLVTIVPFTLKYESAVGLFGAENYFVKVSLDILNTAQGVCYEELNWLCGFVDYSYNVNDLYYETGLVDKSDFTYTDSYSQALVLGDSLPNISGKEAFISIDLNNLKVGNIYIDNWLDVRLYTKDREEHPYEKMYVKTNDFFYIGIHARNTRRLPFNVECVVGKEFLEYDAIEEKQLIMRSTAYGGYGAYDAYEKPMRVRQAIKNTVSSSSEY